MVSSMVPPRKWRALTSTRVIKVIIGPGKEEVRSEGDDHKHVGANPG